MIVLNDCADQILELDHPEVQVINVPGGAREKKEIFPVRAVSAD
jgi:hypothetical protein